MTTRCERQARAGRAVGRRRSSPLARRRQESTAGHGGVCCPLCSFAHAAHAALLLPAQVLVYGPPSGATCEWQRVADLSGRLVQRLEQTGWQDLAPQPPQPPAADATLRLRGGAKRKRPGEPRQGSEGGVYRPAAAFHAAVGQAVEVMTAEEGLEGCWFGGTIQDLQGGWALVAYAALQESEEEGASPLREWFPLPGQRQGPPPSQPAGADGQPLAAHPAEAAPQLRPAPPPKVRCKRQGAAARLQQPLDPHLTPCADPSQHSVQKSAVGGARRVGDVCDAFIDDGWWEGTRVAELQVRRERQPSGPATVSGAASLPPSSRLPLLPAGRRQALRGGGGGGAARGGAGAHPPLPAVPRRRVGGAGACCAWRCSSASAGRPTAHARPERGQRKAGSKAARGGGPASGRRCLGRRAGLSGSGEGASRKEAARAECRQGSSRGLGGQ
jgi:hypothetical protein